MLASIGAAAVAAAALISPPAMADADPGRPAITIEKIMSDPDWIGPIARDPYWSADGRSVYYSAKRSGSPLIDLHRIDLADRKDEVLDSKAAAGADEGVAAD